MLRATVVLTGFACTLTAGPACVEANAAAGGLVVAPSRIDAAVRPGETLPPITLRNDSSRAVSVRVSVVPITQDLSGLPVVDHSAAARATARRVLRAGPTSFRLGPGEGRTIGVRVLRHPLSGIAAYASVVFTARQTQGGNSGGNRIAPAVGISTNLLLRFQGRPHVAGAVTSVRAEQASGTSLDFIADIRNNGNVHAMPTGVLTVT